MIIRIKVRLKVIALMLTVCTAIYLLVNVLDSNSYNSADLNGRESGFEEIKNDFLFKRRPNLAYKIRPKTSHLDKFSIDNLTLPLNSSNTIITTKLQQSSKHPHIISNSIESDYHYNKKATKLKTSKNANVLSVSKEVNSSLDKLVDIINDQLTLDLNGDLNEKWQLKTNRKRDSVLENEGQPQVTANNVKSYLSLFQAIVRKIQGCQNCYAKTGDGPQKSAYAENVYFEDAPIPEEWKPWPELEKKFERRRNHVKEACEKNNLDKRNATNQPNAWEFLIDKKHGMIWCTIFKAASSTWFYNFNTLAGYSEKFLLESKETPTALARKKYPRPTVEELDKAFNNSSTFPVAFMITRHPLERLVSAYRDKIESGLRYYRNLSRQIYASYPELTPDNPIVVTLPEPIRKLLPKDKQIKHIVPSFPQFVQFILDSYRRGENLDQHWVPMNKFCTPCLVNFNIFAKQETLEEDGNYIIHKSGTKEIIHPKVINRSQSNKTDEVAEQYLCRLSRTQMEELVAMYMSDFEVFDYEYQKYVRCTSRWEEHDEGKERGEAGEEEEAGTESVRDG